tara:strand:- start:3143 stop:3541 length:399 start_codon:yes stop_codon:yes gene_type:complete
LSKTQSTTDKVAISLSLVCIIHCFFAPSLIIFTYGFLSFSVENEFIHYVILILALPISILALSLGYRNHKNITFLVIGILGLSFLITAVLFGEGSLEKILTVIGSITIAYAHFRNHRVCKQQDCGCHERKYF